MKPLFLAIFTALVYLGDLSSPVFGMENDKLERLEDNKTNNNTPLILNSTATAIIPEMDEIRDIYAFHVAYKLPKDGILIAGKANGHNKTMPIGEPLPGLANWRPTLHFSLGGLYPDSRENILSTRNHVIIVRVRDLERQLIGLQPLDSFIMGDFEIPKNASLIVPAEEVDESRNLPWVKERDITVIARNTPNLENQISRFLFEKGTWFFTEGSRQGAWIKAKALKGNDTQNMIKIDKAFFSTFLGNNPQIDYAPHDQHTIGFLDMNLHYLLCFNTKKLEFELRNIPGAKEICTLWEAITKNYKVRLHTYSPHLSPLFEKSLRSLDEKLNAEEGTPTTLLRRYFHLSEEDEDFVRYRLEKEIQLNRRVNWQDYLLDHAFSWIAKGNYLATGKVEMIEITPFTYLLEGEVKKYNPSPSPAWKVKAYLSNIGMM